MEGDIIIRIKTNEIFIDKGPGIWIVRANMYEIAIAYFYLQTYPFTKAYEESGEDFDEDVL